MTQQECPDDVTRATSDITRATPAGLGKCRVAVTRPPEVASVYLLTEWRWEGLVDNVLQRGASNDMLKSWFLLSNAQTTFDHLFELF